MAKYPTACSPEVPKLNRFEKRVVNVIRKVMYLIDAPSKFEFDMLKRKVEKLEAITEAEKYDIKKVVVRRGKHSSDENLTGFGETGSFEESSR